MVRISDEILQNVDIVDVIGKYVQLKRAGSNFSGKCPFHNEKTPSFMVSPQKQIFKCFGCGIGGNVITFIKEIERVDFWDAAKILAKEGNIDLTQYEKNYDKYEEMNQGKEKIKRLHKLTQKFFVDSLQTNEKAQKYLKEERKLDTKTIETFGIGYASESHYSLVQMLKSKWFSDADLQEASLAKKGNTGDMYAFFRKRITFPIYDTMNNIIAFSARILDPNDKPKYLNSAEHSAFEKSKVLYGLNLVKKHIKEFGFVIVVEGQMDVIALYQLGYPIAVATSWTAITSQHIKLLKRYTDQVYFLFDNDEAGQRATLRALKIAYQEDIFPKLIDLPTQYKDVDDLAQETDGKEKFQSYLEWSIDAFTSLYMRLKKKMDPSSPVDKQKLMNTFFELILWLPNPSTQMHYLGVLAQKLGQNEEVIMSQYKQYAKKEGKFVIRKQEKTQSQSIYQPQREDIVASLFWQDFILELLPWEDLAQELINLAKSIAELMPDSYLSFLNQKEELLPDDNIWGAQLWWEKEFQSLAKHEDKSKKLKTIVAPSLQELIQQIRKLKNIDQEAKYQLFKKMDLMLKKVWLD